MSQWHKLHWKPEHAEIGGIKLTPKKNSGKLKVHTSHPHHGHDWDALNWDAHADGPNMAHVHDGVVDHIMVHPQERPGGMSVHALWKDKDGNIVRQDCHFQAK